MFCFKKILHKYHKNITLKFKSKNSKVKKLLCGYTGFAIRTHSAQRIIFRHWGKGSVPFGCPITLLFLFSSRKLAVWLCKFIYMSVLVGISAYPESKSTPYHRPIVTLFTPYHDPIITPFMTPFFSVFSRQQSVFSCTGKDKRLRTLGFFYGTKVVRLLLRSKKRYPQILEVE